MKKQVLYQNRNFPNSKNKTGGQEQGRKSPGDEDLYFLRPLVSLDASALTEKTGNTWSVNL